MTQPAHTVHVWSTNLDVGGSILSEFAGLLSPSELERARRFRFDRDRDRFIAGREFLRSVLGHYLGVQPRGLEFAYGPNGKPALKGACARLHFNFSHSANLALLGVTRVACIGIDVEQVRPMPEAEELVERFFSPRETAQFRALPEEQKQEGFFNLWTRKEAFLKATGEGIGYMLNKVEVSFLPGDRPQFLSLPEGQIPRGPWGLFHLSPVPGFVGAVAIPVRDVAVVCRGWEGTRPDERSELSPS
jgi:4'-phosphopantetheinyl transferase